MTDVVIGSVRGYGWPEMETFIASVELSGFAGDRIMFTEDVAPELLNKLRLLGWTVMPTHTEPGQDYGTARHIPVLEFLRATEYRYVVYCDVRDVVFQTDPTVWLEHNLEDTPWQLACASECLRICDQETNQGWIRSTFGEEILQKLMKENILCAGTIAGTHAAVSKLLSLFCELGREVSGWGFDQAFLNYLVRVPPMREITTVPRMREGFIATCSWFLSGPERFTGLYTDEVPVFDTESCLVRAPITLKPFAIVHQYDRGFGWDRIMRERYKL